MYIVLYGWSNFKYYLFSSFTFYSLALLLPPYFQWCFIVIICMCASFYMSVHCQWWRHQMKTFSALLALCEGNPPVTGGFPSQRPVTRSFDVFFHLHMDKRLNKQSRRRWFETASSSLWRHCHAEMTKISMFNQSIWKIKSSKDRLFGSSLV